MTKGEFKKKWAPKVKNTSGTHIVAGWEEDLEAMLDSELVTREIQESQQPRPKSNLLMRGNRDYPGTKEG